MAFTASGAAIVTAAAATAPASRPLAARDGAGTKARVRPPVAATPAPIRVATRRLLRRCWRELAILLIYTFENRGN